MQKIVCGNVLVTSDIEFSIACFQCDRVDKSFAEYQVHIIEEHMHDIFNNDFEQKIEFEFKDEELTNLSISDAQQMYGEKDNEFRNNTDSIKSEDSSEIDHEIRINGDSIESEDNETASHFQKQVLSIKNEIERHMELETSLKKEDKSLEIKEEEEKLKEEELEFDKADSDFEEPHSPNDISHENSIEMLDDDTNMLEEEIIDDETNSTDENMCRVCEKSFPDKEKFENHEKRCKCGKCPMCGQGYSDIWSHISTYHKAYYLQRKLSGQAVYERPLLTELYCEYCDRKFRKERPFRIHVHTHKKNLDKCNICGKFFKSKVLLETHIRTHTGERPFKCSECPNAFSDNANLRTHFIVKHTEGVNAKCRFEACDKTFKTTELRNRHEKYMHENKRDYLCLNCGASFKTSSKLDMHIKIKHTDYNDRPYKCSICDKKYVTKRDIDHHMSTHTGERPYECEICKKKFNIKFSYSKHMKNIHSKLN